MTHLWSELGGSKCQSVEIRIAGPPSTSEKYDFFTSVVLTGHGETIAVNRPNGYFNNSNASLVAQYVITYSEAVGIFKYADYDRTQGNLTAAAIRNGTTFVTPSATTITGGSYGAFSQLLYMVINTPFTFFAESTGFIKFGYAYGDTLVRDVGLFPLSQADKEGYSVRFNYFAPCFSETSIVEVKDKGFIRINEIRVGDMVKGDDGKFSLTYSWAHYGPHEEADFIQILVAGLAKPLELTSEHMVFLAGGSAVPASAVVVGNELKLATGGSGRVFEKQNVIRRGIYGPLTASGKIAVDGVVCSVYVDLQNDSGVLKFGSYKTPFSVHALTHMFQAFHRLVCRASLSFRDQESHTRHGLSTRLVAPLAAAEWFFKQRTIVMVMVFIPVFVWALSFMDWSLSLTTRF